MTDLVALKVACAKRFAQAKILPSRRAEVFAVARRLVVATAKARYLAISQATGVPWFIIAVIHEREASQRWDRQLGQGDPLNQISHNKPRGRGPFSDHDGYDAFYWGAVDALKNCPPFAARWTDWSAGGALVQLILYNGTGYEDFHHEASPYDWGATNIQTIGKYIADGKFDSTKWDTQVGCAAMLLAMMELDPTITFTGVKIAITIDAPQVPRQQTPEPSLTPAAPVKPAGMWASIITAVLSAFKRKTP